MKKTYFKLVIDETACNSPKDTENSARFNQIVKKADTVEEIEAFLNERYGKVVSKQTRIKNGVYVDKEGGGAERVGFLYSFWNKDWSHNSKNWFQTDWITINKVIESPVLV